MSNERIAKLLIEALVKQGVRDFCLSPGSRSTPLTLAIAEHPEAISHVHFDERGMAFQALGIAQGSKRPVVVCVTSGTAVGNLFPAVMEAFHSHTPLIILTADRPPEERDCGANQTIDQVKIFGSFVREAVDLPCPSNSIPDAYFVGRIARALFKAQQGPVHLNCMFREPLFSETPCPWPEVPERTYVPLQTVPVDLEKWAHLFSFEKKGIIIAGKLSSSDGIAELAEKLKWPLFADLLSGIRGNGIFYYDLLLKAQEDFSTECVLHFGGRFLTKSLLHYLEKCKPKLYVHVSEDPSHYDPAHLVTHHMPSCPALFCQYMLTAVKTQQDSTWLNMWKEPEEHIKTHLQETLKKESEPGLMHTLATILPYEWTLFLSNSMPVRDADAFLFRKEGFGPIFSNRGVSGSDGNIATGVGVAIGTQAPTLAVLGDQAFLHDLNSLALLKKSPYPIILLVINNGGGGIFSLLPIAKKTPHFEKFWAAAHTMTFEKAAELFDIPYQKGIENLEALFQQPQTCIVEMTSSRQENVRIHEQLNFSAWVSGVS